MNKNTLPQEYTISAIDQKTQVITIASISSINSDQIAFNL